jgi:hypothetical protein
VDSVLLAARDAGYVRASSSFPAFGSGHRFRAAIAAVLDHHMASDLR